MPQFSHGVVELVGHRTRIAPQEQVGDAAVVPHLAGPPAPEPLPDLVAHQLVVEKDGAGVVQLVGDAHAQHLGRLGLEPFQVGALALIPGRLGPHLGVTAGADDGRDPLAKPVADLLEARSVSAILQRVVQQGGDRLVLGTAVLQHQRRDAEQVRQIRHIAALSTLAGMDIGGVHKRVGEAAGEHKRDAIERRPAHSPDGHHAWLKVHR